MQVSEYARHATKSFALPDICTRIREMLDGDTSDIEDISRIVSLDPSLSSKLLKLANSPLFRFRSQIDSISKAVNVIGGEALYNLVIAETASSMFEHFANEQVDLRRFWMQSIYCGLVAKHLAKLSRIRGSERFFLLGLLHNLGELVVTGQSLEVALQCNDIDPDTLPWKHQQKVLGFTFIDCTAEVLKMWQLPAQLHCPIADAHDEDKALISKEVAILFTSVRAATAMVSNGRYSINSLINPVIMAAAQLEEDFLDDAVDFSRVEALKMINIMGSSLK